MLCCIPFLAQEKIGISPISINTLEREYAPAYYKDGIVFSGVNNAVKALTYLDHKTENQLTDLFFSTVNNGKFEKRKIFSSELKTNFHNGPITFSADNKTAYFTRSTKITKKENKRKTQNKLGIFKATFDGTKWGNITACSFNSTDYNVGQPSLSSDGKRLYIASDKEGGYGKMDLYYSNIIDGVCDSLINLGETINSSANEIFPFIGSQNKLYFSSDKTGGYGGLDIYSSINNENSWAQPIPLDTIINSPFDDFSIIYKQDQTEGYFTSNRNGSDDIFKIEVLFPEFGECELVIDPLFCYDFFEESSLNTDSIPMLYQWDFGDGTKEESLEVKHCYKKPGYYIINLNILDPVIDEVFITKDTYELNIEEIIQPKITVPDSIIENEEFSIIIEQGNWKDYVIENFYIDFDDSTIIKSDSSNHSYKLIGKKELKILISGYEIGSNELTSNCFYKIIYVIKPKDLETEK